jgi:alpha-tubulin suppressor-like RCC1 family protein
MLSSLKRVHQNGTRTMSTVYSWGVGSNGQLGHTKFKMNRRSIDGGMSYVQTLPRRVAGSSDLDFQQLALGENFSVGISSKGYLYGWGRFWGLKNQAEIDVLEPVVLLTDTKFSKVSAGKTHAAAISTEGQIYTFGAYEKAESGFFSFLGAGPKGGWLGHGDDTNCDVPRMIESFKEEYGDVKAIQTACGDMHTLVLTDDGEVLTCGVSEGGRLGTGDNEIIWTLKTIEGLLDHTIVKIAAGSSCSFALTDDDKMFAWGQNNNGQLGYQIHTWILIQRRLSQQKLICRNLRVERLKILLPRDLGLHY